MLPPLNVQPTGLLSFFGIKTGGRYPEQLATFLTPTIELLPWYAAFQWLEVETGSAMTIIANTNTSALQITATSPTNLSAGGQLRVPQTELWYIPRWKVGWTIDNAAGFTDATLELVGGTGPIDNPPNALSGFTGGAAMTRAGHRSGIEPVFALPGTVIQIRQFGTQPGAGGTVAFNFALKLVRLRI